MLEDGRRFKYEAMKMLADMAAIVKQMSASQAEECLSQVFKHLVVRDNNLTSCLNAVQQLAHGLKSYDY